MMSEKSKAAKKSAAISLFILLLFCCFSASAQPRRYIVVWEVKATSEAQPIDTETLTRLLRGAATNALADRGYSVITEESIQVVLKEQGKSIETCEDGAQCLAEIAGAYGADYMIASSIGRLGQAYIWQFDLYNTKNGALLRSIALKTNSVENFANRLHTDYKKLFAKLLRKPKVKDEASAADESSTNLRKEGSGKPKRKSVYGMLTVDADPNGEAYLDGERIGRTPITGKTVKSGWRELLVFRKRYQIVKERIYIPPNDLAVYDFKLTRLGEEVGEKTDEKEGPSFTLSGVGVGLLGIGAIAVPTGLLMMLNEGGRHSDEDGVDWSKITLIGGLVSIVSGVGCLSVSVLIDSDPEKKPEKPKEKNASAMLMFSRQW